MTRTAKRYLTSLVFSVIALFLWIFIAVALTGGREPSEFTMHDEIVMFTFMIVEIGTAIVALVLAVMLGREQGKSKYLPVNTDNNTTRTRGERVLPMVLAFVLALAIVLAGIALRGSFSACIIKVAEWVLWICCAVAALALTTNVVLKRRYVDRIEKQQVGQIQQFVYSHRERAEEMAAQKLKATRFWRKMTTCYAILLGALGVVIAVCAGLTWRSGFCVVLCFVAILLIMSVLFRIRISKKAAAFDQDNAYISEEQFPGLYRLAKRAAKTIGCSGAIRIALLPNCNAGIARVGRIYSVQLGVILLSILSEQELYSVLLHEFAHMAGNNNVANKERDYHIWLCEGKVSHVFFAITNSFYSFFDTAYELQYLLYEYASTILMETAADQAMLLCGDPNAAASAMTKIQYYDLFVWEKGTEDEPCAFEQEQPEEHWMEKELQKFLQKVGAREAKWQQLLAVEIQSRSATHPILRRRLEALGITEPQIVMADTESCHAKECAKALAYVDDLIFEEQAEDYEERRKAFYLEPKAQVDAWEQAGKPVIAQEYGDVVWALRQLGRNTEAMALCERAIEELPRSASNHGYFMRGCYRLHCFDEAGIADIYTAIEGNMNYLQEGIDAIGAFCCMTGNQSELDIYRDKAVALHQKHKDEYSHVGILRKKDKLSAEHLPGNMLEDILAYIRSIDNGQIEKIYLVRKTITDDFFTSVFVIRFDLQANEEECSVIYRKIFQYLDTCSDWQFSLFDYYDVLEAQVYRIENSCVYSNGRY